jgi:serine/threonine protein kinase
MTATPPIPDATLAHLRAIAAADDAEYAARYTRVALLGEGGMGAVYRCWDTVLEREVAMKVALAPPGPGSALLAERLRAEARVLARLEHAGIVPVHDAGRLPDGRVFYVMKCVRGRALSDVLRETLPLARRLDVLERVTEAVAFAHEQGIVHRDLKPANIMVGDFGEVLVADWGVAKVLGSTPPPAVASEMPPLRSDNDGLTGAGMVLGTPGFMAPEQASGKSADVGPTADVYALGALMVALLGGTAPSATTSARALLGAARDVPPPLRSVARRCLAPEASARYPTAGALLDDLRRYRSGERVAAHREHLLARLLRVLRPWRTPILLVAAYLVMRMVVAWIGTGRSAGP